MVVSGHGAFVVNNPAQAYSSAELQAASKLVQVALMGPASEPAHAAAPEQTEHLVAANAFLARPPAGVRHRLRATLRLRFSRPRGRAS